MPYKIAEAPRRAQHATVDGVALGLGFVVLVLIPAGCAGPARTTFPVTVLAASGPFRSIEEAARAEDRVNWLDPDRADDDACTESFAAVELRDHLLRSMRVPADRIVVSNARRLPGSGDVIVLGSRRSNPLVGEMMERSAKRASDASLSLGGEDAFTLEVLCRDGRRVYIIQGEGRSGTLYGAYDLLERMGVRFYGLGDNGTLYPDLPVTLPPTISVHASPAFRTRGFWAWEPRGHPDFFLWMARNRLNLWTAAEPHAARLHKLGITLTGGGHGVQLEFLNPARYFSSHPEWYGLHGGRRSPRIDEGSGDNFCTSNAGAVRELSRNIIESLATGSMRDVGVFNLWPLDGGRWCECDSCGALGTPTDRMLDLLAHVAAAVNSARRAGALGRDVVLSAPAYLETLAPPTRPWPASARRLRCTVTFFPYLRCYAHALGDPACRELNARSASSLSGWVQAARHGDSPQLAIGEYYNVSFFKSLPLVFPSVMEADLRAYAAGGARDFHYMHAPTDHWGSWELNHALLARLLWTPADNADSIVAEYVTRSFPSTADSMRAFFRDLELSSANVTALEFSIGALGYTGAPAGRLTDPGVSVFPLRHLQPESRAPGPNPAPSWGETLEAMRRARRAIDAARAGARDSAERARIETHVRRFAYGEATYALYDALLRTTVGMQIGQRDAAARMLAVADSVARVLAGMRDIVQGSSSHANARNGLDASHVEPALAYFRKQLAGR